MVQSLSQLHRHPNCTKRHSQRVQCRRCSNISDMGVLIAEGMLTSPLPIQ